MDSPNKKEGQPKRPVRMQSLDGFAFVSRKPIGPIKNTPKTQDNPSPRVLAEYLRQNAPNHKKDALVATSNNSRRSVRRNPVAISEFVRRPTIKKATPNQENTAGDIAKKPLMRQNIMPNTKKTNNSSEINTAKSQNANNLAENSDKTATKNQKRAAKKQAKIARKASRSKSRKIIRRVLFAIGIIVLITGGYLGWKFLNNSSKLFGGNIFSNISGVVSGSPLKGQDVGRVNILLAGNSKDEIGHDGATLTDSIMVISIDTDSNRAIMLSIPRDLWIEIPDVGYRKINEAYHWGEQNKFDENGYPKGGMGLLEKTISQAFEIDINYYSLISYNAFRDAVNAVGGITVDIESSDPRGLYDPTFKKREGGPLKLSNGKHDLNGNQALMLARARGHDGGYGYASSDFTRTENQRKMLLALKDKALSVGVLSNPVKIGNLMDSLGNNVLTDFKMGEIRTLVGLAGKIKDIDSLSFVDKDTKLLSNYTTSTGQSALVPTAGIGEYEDIREFLAKSLSKDPLVREGSSIIILNGTDTNGLAGEQQKRLEKAKLAIKGIDTTSPTDKTVIYVDSSIKKPSTRALLANLYPGASVKDTAQANMPRAVDFVVVIGKDFDSGTSQ